MKKKILSFILSIALLAGMVLSPLPAEAFDFSGSDREYKLSYTPKLMTEAEGNYPFRYDADGELKVATQKWERVTRQGYANITTYKAPEDGILGTINKAEGDTAYVQFSEVGAVVEFCIADNDGNILYPYNNNVITIDDNETHTFNDIEISVKQGQEINFIFYGVKCSGTIGFDFIAHMSFKNSTGTMTRVDNTFRLWPPSGEATQGSDNLYFKYADDYAKIADAGLDMGPVYQKKLNFTKELMVPAESGYYTLIAPGQQGACGSQYYGYGTAAGYANIITFKSPEDGTFQVRNMTLSLSSYNRYSFDFAITDSDGHILYPTDQSILTIGNGVQSQSSIAAKKTVKAGEEINFICFGTDETVPGIAMTAEIYVNGVSYCSGNIWPGSNTAIWPEGRQTTDVLTNTDKYYQYYYSKNVTVENLVKAPWSEFVSLDQYETAPNTIETWVKISDAVADNKRGIIVSNGGMTGYDDDLTIAMDYNGNPRIYSTSNNFDFTVNADLRTGEWTHLAFVNDQANNKMYCYLNGVLKGICNDSYDSTKYGTGYDYVIGNNNYYDQGNAFQGEIRDLRFWSDARSASEISDNQNATLKGSEEGLLGTWALNDYNSTVTYFTDRTAAANHGKLVSPYDKFVEAEAVTDYDYSMAVIGDTQYYVESETNVQNFYNITQYLSELEKKPSYVMQVGDITSDNGENHYTKALTAMGKLKDAGIPHSIALGNHDYPSAGKVDRNSTNFNTYFSQEYFEAVSDMEFYPEYYEVTTSSAYTKTVVADDAESVAENEIKLSDVTTRSCESQSIEVGDYVFYKSDNNYRLLTAGDTKYMIVTLEFNPRNEVIDWANEVVAAHPEHKVIVCTHGYTQDGEIIKSSSYYLGKDGNNKDTNQNEPNVLWSNFVSKHENIFMLFCGHAHAPEITSNVMVGDNGNTVYQYMVAPTMGNGGDGVFLMMYFNETSGTVDFRYYSPTEDKYWGYQNMLQVDLDNSNTNTDIVEVTKPNIATDGILKSFPTGNLNNAGYWLAGSSPLDNVRFVKLTANSSEYGIQATDDVSVVRQYKATKEGNGKFLIYLGYIKTSQTGNVNSNRSIDFAIYNSKGENITSTFRTGDSAVNAVKGLGGTYIRYNATDDVFDMQSTSSSTAWLYAEVTNISAGDSFYFVTTANGGQIFQGQRIYVGGDIQHPDSVAANVSGVEGAWTDSHTDFPTSSAVTAGNRQGYLGWYYKYVYDSDLKNYSYSAKKAQVNVNIVGDGTISPYTTSATYDAATGKITLPHDNSLFVDVKKAEGSVLSAVYWNDIPVAHTTSTDASIRVNVPCVGDGGTLTVIFIPITDSVTIDGVATYFDYGTQELGDVNGTDGIDVRDLVRTVSHLEDSTVAIKAYNADINKDKKIDKEDTSALRGKLLK